MSKYISISEAARILDVSRVTVYKWIDAGLLHVYHDKMLKGRPADMLRSEVEALREKRNAERDEALEGPARRVAEPRLDYGSPPPTP